MRGGPGSGTRETLPLPLRRFWPAIPFQAAQHAAALDVCSCGWATGCRAELIRPVFQRHTCGRFAGLLKASVIRPGLLGQKAGALSVECGSCLQNLVGHFSL